MYKIKTLLLVCSTLPLLASCLKDPETHQLTPIESSLVLYADQTTDSLRFYTFDSWKVTPQADWITVLGSPQSDLNYSYTKRYLCRVMLSFMPNTTGRTRIGSALVQSYEYAYSAPFVQLGVLRLTHPGYTVDSWLDEQSRIPDVVHYELKDSAHWTADSICFSVENNWDLVYADETVPDWLQFDKSTGRPREHHCVNLTLTPNTDTENGREARLKLISGEVSNIITVRQLPAKKNE